MSKALLGSGEDPQPGDLIEIYRSAYQHWAVYVGGGYVVHLTGQSGSGSCSGNVNVSGVPVGGGIAKVKRQKLEDVAGQNKWRVNNSLDKMRKPLPAWDIVEKARSLVDSTQTYAIFGDNCEDFATKLRYGKKWSRQALAAVAVSVAAGVFTGGLGGIVLVSLGLMGMVATVARR